MRRFVTVLCLAAMMVLILFCLTGCGEKTGDGGDGKLIVAMELAYPPFETKDEAGNPTGVSVDLAKAFGGYIDRDVEILNVAWEGLIPSLETGKADMIISSMTITPERQKTVDFSDPYAKALLAILTNKDSDVASIEDLNKPGKKVAVKIGSTGDIYANKNLTEATIIPLADESACVMEVVQGKADGFIYDQLTIYRNNQNNPDTTGAVYIPFQDVEYWGAAMKKGNEELLSQMNEFIAYYREAGGFDELTEKYLQEESKAFKALGFQWFFDIQ